MKPVRIVPMALMFFAIFSFLQGCGKKAADVEKECVVNADQTRTFTGHWPTHPIPIAVEAVGFNATEQQGIIAAVATWNEFFNASKSFEIIYSGSSSLNVQNSTVVTSATVCSQPIVTPGGFAKKVMIYKKTSNWVHGSSAIAVTSTCPVPDSSNTQFKRITAAVMEVNAVDYFSSGKPLPDMQSIMTHELGHLLGLGHSCGSFSNGSTVSCNDDYVQAMMYPSLGFSGANGQVKRELNSNDQGRANCLY